MKTLEINKNLIDLIFEPKMEVQVETTMEEAFIIRQKETLKIMVNSVAFPPNFTGDLRTENQFCDWLQNKVFSPNVAYYNYAKKYKDC